MHEGSRPARAVAAATLALATFAAAQARRDDGVRRALSVQSEAQLTRLLGAHPFAVLAARARLPRAEAAAQWPHQRGDVPLHLHREALVCGLWSSDREVAFTAASVVPEQCLDLADIDRYLAICRPRLFEPDLRFSWDTFSHCLDPAGVTAVLRGMARAPRECDARHMLGDLHRLLRMAHAEPLAALCHHPDSLLRVEARAHLAYLTHFAPGPRSLVASVLLEWSGGDDVRLRATPDAEYTPRRYQLPAERPGWPAALRACLHRLYLELPAPPGDPTARWPQFAPFLLRWAADEVPTDADIPLLVSLLGSDRSGAHAIALRAARSLSSNPRLDTALRRFIETRAPDESGHYWLAHAAAGGAARGQLIAHAARDATALAVALEIAPNEAAAAWAATLTSPAHATAGIDRLIDAHDLCGWAPVHWSPNAPAAIGDVLDRHAPTLPYPALHRLLGTLPRYRTAATVNAYAQATDGPRSVDCHAALLEVHDRADLRARLAAWRTHADSAVTDHAHLRLLQLGATAHGPDLVRWTDGRPAHWITLARAGGSKAVRDALSHRLRTHPPPGGEFDETALIPLAAAAALTVPERAARNWLASLRRRPDLVAAHYDTWRDAVLAGNAASALRHFAQAQPMETLEPRGLGLVDDAALRAHLHTVRATPGAAVQAVIGELALAGEASALHELARVRARKLYGWIDDSRPAILTLGNRLDLTTEWIDELGTICCRRNAAASALEALTGFDAHDAAEHGLVGQRDHARAWFDAVRDRLRFSRIAQRFVVAPAR